MFPFSLSTTTPFSSGHFNYCKHISCMPVCFNNAAAYFVTLLSSYVRKSPQKQPRQRHVSEASKLHCCDHQWLHATDLLVLNVTDMYCRQSVYYFVVRLCTISFGVRVSCAKNPRRLRLPAPPLYVLVCQCSTPTTTGVRYNSICFVSSTLVFVLRLLDVLALCLCPTTCSPEPFSQCTTP